MDEATAQISKIFSPAKAFLFQLGDYLLLLLIAVLILIAGWMLAKFLAFTVVKGLKIINFNVLTEKAGMDKFLKQGGIKKSTIDILGILIYWLTILITLLVAFNTLGLAVVSDLFSQITQFIPKVIVAVLILAIGLYFARFIEDAIAAYGKNVGMEGAGVVARLSRYAIVVFVFVIALGQMDVGGDLIKYTFLLLFGGIVLALSLAFGLGGGQKMVGTWVDKFIKKEKKKS